MASAEAIRSIVEYNYAMHRRMWESIRQLSDEQFLQPMPYSHGSVRNQVIHVAGVDRRWLAGLLGKADVGHLTTTDYPSIDAACALCEGVAHDVLGFVADLDDDGLEQFPPYMPGPAWQILAHLVNHGTDHRAQILRALHDLGLPTFDQDLILYLWKI